MEIRAKQGPFACRLVAVELRAEQRIATLLKLGLGEAFKEWKLYGDSSIFAPPVGQFYTNLIGLDLPVVLPVPRDVPLAGFFPSWDGRLVYFLYVWVIEGKSRDSEIRFEERFPVPIKTYDTLPLYRQFNEPFMEQHPLPDGQIVVDVSVPVSSLGPGDTCTVEFRVRHNPLHNKRKRLLRLKEVTLQLKELVECYDGGLPLKKEYKLRLETVVFDAPVTSEGTHHRFSFAFPFENDFLELFSASPAPEPGFDSLVVTSPSASFHKNKNNLKIPDGVPVTHTQGFTNSGKLFLLRYEFILKVRIAHGKDVIAHVPVTVSPFNRAACVYLLNWIKSECMVAADIFGRENVARMARSFKPEEVQSILNRFTPPPRFYRSHDYERLGYFRHAFID